MGTMLLILAGVLLVYALQRWLYRHFWDRGLSVSIRFADHDIEEGQTGTLVETIENRKILPLVALRVKFETDRHLDFGREENISVNDRSYKNDIFSVLMYQRITRRLIFTGTRRGLYAIEGADLSTSDLFMSDTLWKQTAFRTEVYVYPGHADAARLMVAFRRLNGEIEIQKRTYPDPFAFAGIRPYEIYDSMRDINWKASARTGELRTNVFADTVRQEVCLLLNLENDGVLERKELKEESIRITHSLAELLIGQGIPVSAYANAQDMLSNQVLHLPAGADSSHLNSLRESLARLDLSRPMEDFTAELVRRKREQNVRTDVIYVLISSSQREEMAEAFGELAAMQSEAMWILPLRSGETPRAEVPARVERLLWEVS